MLKATKCKKQNFLFISIVNKKSAHILINIHAYTVCGGKGNRRQEAESKKGVERPFFLQ